jgi:hypothetical protein
VNGIPEGSSVAARHFGKGREMRHLILAGLDRGYRKVPESLRSTTKNHTTEGRYFLTG